MRCFNVLTGLAALVMMIMAWGGPAQAQAVRTLVSGVGDDANPCTRTAPCKTFAGAISKTAALGEIDCLDSGGFGVLTITKAITIDCGNVIAGVQVAGGTNGVTVAAGTNDRVVLRGLDFEGSGSGLNGISFVSGAALEIDHVIIRDFTGSGIAVANSGSAQVFISDSQIVNNGAAGISLASSAALNLFASIDNVRLDDNATGLDVTGAASSGTLRVSVRNSVAAGNSGAGAKATGGTGPLKLMVDASAFVNNDIGLSSSGAKSQIQISNSEITGNQTGLQTAGGGLLVSFGDNRLSANVVTQGAFTGSVAKQ